MVLLARVPFPSIDRRGLTQYMMVKLPVLFLRPTDKPERERGSSRKPPAI